MDTTKLAEALLNDKFEEALTLVKEYDNVNEYDARKQLPLHILVAYSGSGGEVCMRAIEEILKKGADPNLTVEKPYGVLKNEHSPALAVAMGYDLYDADYNKKEPPKDLIELLLKHGADLNQVIGSFRYNLKTVLSIACGDYDRANPDFIEYLIGKGAKVNIRQEDYPVELQKKLGIDGEEYGYDEFDKAIRKKWDIESPLRSAMYNKKKEVISLLLSKGAEFKVEYLTSLIDYSGAGAREPIEALLEANVDLSGEDYKGSTILDAAIEGGDKEFIAYIKSKNIVKSRVFSDKELKKLDQAMQKQSRIAFQPLVEKGETKENNKFSGTPLLLKNEKWPLCSCCKQAMPLLFQLDLATLPAPAKEILGSEGIVQIFYCQNEVKEELCENKSEAWEYKSQKSKLVRLIDKKNCIQPGEKPFLPKALPAIYIKGWTQVRDYPSQTELKLSGDNNKVYVMTSDQNTYENQVINKLGGWPTWIQDTDYPKCKTCKKKMQMIFQFVSETDHGWSIGDCGAAYLMQCSEHKSELAFGWQGA